MIDLLTCFRCRDHPIRLNSEFHLDLQWWHEFLSAWHGVSFCLYPGMSAAPDLEVTCDTTGSLGFGAYFKGEWFSGAWVPCQSEQSIAYKELFPVIIASHVWGPQWFRQQILFRSDNEAVVHILSSRTSKILCIMYLLRKLFFFTLLRLSMYQVFLTRLLMRSLDFRCRSSNSWPQRLRCILCQSQSTFWRN